VGVFQATKKLVLSEREGRERVLEFLRKNAANGLSVANLLAGLSSILCSVNRGGKKGGKWGEKVGWGVGGTMSLVEIEGKWGKKEASTGLALWPSWWAAPLRPQKTGGGKKKEGFFLEVFPQTEAVAPPPPGIPFTYRGLPCPYPSALLASTFVLSGGHVALLRVAAAAMIVAMADCGSYPHDRVLESQRWKKVVYAGGVLAVLLAPAPVAAVYCLAWAVSYIAFPSALWSCKA
ncbi:TM269 protein, partial [Tyrannus savana]|nr:TM269 protein [Tyrannus savana]